MMHKAQSVLAETTERIQSERRGEIQCNDPQVYNGEEAIQRFQNLRIIINMDLINLHITECYNKYLNKYYIIT